MNITIIVIGVFLLLMVIYYYNYIRNILIMTFIKNKVFITLLSIIFGLICFILCFNIYNNVGIFFLYLALTSMVMDFIIILLRDTTNKEVFRKESIHILYIIPLIITSVACIYGNYNMANIVKKEYNIETNKMLADNIKVLFISDSHYGSSFNNERLTNLVNEINSIDDIDIVLLGGDIVDEKTTKDEMKQVFSSFGKIKSKHGIYYVYGNHDRQTYSRSAKFNILELDSAINDSGIKILNDNIVTLDNSIGSDISIIGREDNSYFRSNISELITDSIKDNYIIVVDHQPLEYDEVSSSGADLIVSGHTHGGQIFPLGMFIDIFKTSEMSYGIKQVNNMEAIVSSGVSGWAYPSRTEHHSEYVIINVSRRNYEY